MNVSSFNPLSILLRNSNGLLKHRNELMTLLNEKCIGIALLTETYLTNKHNFYVSGYKILVYRTDRPDGTAHGSAAILIRSSISHYNDPSPISLDCMQSTTVNIQSYKRLPIAISQSTVLRTKPYQQIPYHHSYLLSNLDSSQVEIIILNTKLLVAEPTTTVKKFSNRS